MRRRALMTTNFEHGRKDMSKGAGNTWTRGRGPRLLTRRRAVIGTGLFGGALVAASTAWACTLLIGTFTVCSPPSASFVGSSQCSQRTSVAGQSGLASVSKGGSSISVTGVGFSTSPTAYSITFQRPGAGGSCHAHNPDGGVTSLLGTDASGNPNTVIGPAFAVGLGAGLYPSVSTPAVTTTGQATVCVQDEPERVDGNFVRVTVV